MTPFKAYFILAASLIGTLGLFTGCETSDSNSTHVTRNTYYGVGFYDPWYYGDYDDDRNVIIVPPTAGNRPDRPDSGLHPEHPIASPPQVSRPAMRPMPSIPSTPRPAFRGGGGGRR